jgi:hypothetical protein
MNTGFTVDELKKSVKNPFYEKLNRKVTVSIRHEDYEVYLDTAKQNGEKITPEDIMRRCLADYAKVLKEHE